MAVLGILVGCAGARARAPAAQRRLFEFRSGLWVNLHQRLMAETNPPRVQAAPQAGADSFSPGEQAAWEAALELYRRRVPERRAHTPLSDDQVDLNQRLSRQGNAPDLRGAGLDPELTARLEAAAVVYRARGWPEDDRHNGQWIAASEPARARLGDAIASELVTLLQTSWPEEPIRVEVSVHAGILGAYTAGQPASITISSSLPRYQGDAALEMVFHEASHVLIDAVERAIARECERQKKAYPESFWHALLFYTAGEVVRRHLPNGYVPYAYANGLYERSPEWQRYEQLLKKHWQPYLDGAVRMDAAIQALVAELEGAAPGG